MAKRPSAPASASLSADPLGRFADQPGVGGIGRELAAEIALSGGASEHLIVGRQQLDAAVRPSPELHTGTEQLLAQDPLLHDPTVGLELGHVVIHRHLGRLELHGPYPHVDLGPTIRLRQVADPGQVDQGVAGTGHALVGLDDHLTDRGPGDEHVADRVTDRRQAVQVLDPERMRDLAVGEQPPAAALGPEVGQPGICPVHRDAETQGEITFELGGVVRQQVAVLAVGYLRRDPGQQSRSLQQLRGQRPVRGVVGGQQREPSQRVARDDTGQQSEVVLHDARVDRHRGDVDHPQVRLPQQQEEEQESFLVGLGDGRAAAACPRDGDRWHHHDGLVVQVELHRRPDRHHALLQLLEPASSLGVVEIGEHRTVRALVGRLIVHPDSPVWIAPASVSTPVTSKTRMGRLNPLRDSAPTSVPIEAGSAA